MNRRPSDTWFHLVMLYPTIFKAGLHTVDSKYERILGDEEKIDKNHTFHSTCFFMSVVKCVGCNDNKNKYNIVNNTQIYYVNINTMLLTHMAAIIGIAARLLRLFFSFFFFIVNLNLVETHCCRIVFSGFIKRNSSIDRLHIWSCWHGRLNDNRKVLSSQMNFLRIEFRNTNNFFVLLQRFFRLCKINCTNETLQCENSNLCLACHLFKYFPNKMNKGKVILWWT